MIISLIDYDLDQWAPEEMVAYGQPPVVPEQADETKEPSDDQ